MDFQRTMRGSTDLSHAHVHTVCGQRRSRCGLSAELWYVFNSSSANSQRQLRNADSRTSTPTRSPCSCSPCAECPLLRTSGESSTRPGARPIPAAVRTTQLQVPAITSADRQASLESPTSSSPELAGDSRLSVPPESRKCSMPRNDVRQDPAQATTNVTRARARRTPASLTGSAAARLGRRLVQRARGSTMATEFRAFEPVRACPRRGER
ncbi:hypothetical protein C8Q80DRAFT_206900 [Daedaleopsis nitida]|nr:hypothetical protein C8Q80DRAFT_206900 [Daedaleopsis nitida]